MSHACAYCLRNFLCRSKLDHCDFLCGCNDWRDAVQVPGYNRPCPQRYGLNCVISCYETYNLFYCSEKCYLLFLWFQSHHPEVLRRQASYWGATVGDLPTDEDCAVRWLNCVHAFNRCFTCRKVVQFFADIPDVLHDLGHQCGLDKIPMHYGPSYVFKKMGWDVPIVAPRWPVDDVVIAQQSLIPLHQPALQTRNGPTPPDSLSDMLAELERHSLSCSSPLLQIDAESIDNLRASLSHADKEQPVLHSSSRDTTSE